MSQPDQFALDAAVAPGRILLGQAQHQFTDLVTDRWAAALVWICPLLGDQAAMPSQQRAGGNDAVAAQLAGKKAGQGGQDRSVRPSESRFADLTAQHRDFVAQDEDLDVLGSGSAGEQPEPAEHRDRDQIQQPK